MFNRSHLARGKRAKDRFHDEVLDAIEAAPIRERQIRHDALWVFGEHDETDGSIVVNVPLIRVAVGLHELTHRVRPAWCETAVRRRSTQLLHTLTDDDVATINQDLVAAIKASR